MYLVEKMSVYYLIHECFKCKKRMQRVMRMA